MKLLDGKVCLITGVAARHSIGSATEHLFAAHGARLVVADIAITPDASPDRLALRCDVANTDDCAAVVSAGVTHFGRIDALVHCAGIVAASGLLDIADDDFDRMIAVNLKGSYNFCRAVLPQMVAQGAGAITLLASLAAQRGGGLVGGAHYAAAKGGVLSLARSVAREFGPSGVRANAICPGMTQTGMIDDVAPDAIRRIAAEIPLRRLGTPEDIAGACLFLASDLSAFVNGATLDVNGGFHIH